MGEKKPIEKLRDRLRELSMRDEAVTNTPDTLARWADIVDAHLTQPAQAVDVGTIERSDVWVVQDEAGHPIHCAGWPQACREHIREAINEHGIEEARAWKVLHYTNGATA